MPLSVRSRWRRLAAAKFVAPLSKKTGQPCKRCTKGGEPCYAHRGHRMARLAHPKNGENSLPATILEAQSAATAG